MPRPILKWTPYTAIGQLLVRFTGEGTETTVRGTAFRVAPQQVLTAAHLLKPKDNEQYVSAQVVFPLLRETLTYDVRSVWRHPQYNGKRLDDTVHDIAICKLTAAPENGVPTIGSIGKSPAREDRRREVAGFLFATGEEPQCVSSLVEIEPWVDESKPFFYPLHSTEQGMSGGPVFGTEDGRLVVDGIIVGDDNVKCRAAPLRTTTAMRFLRTFLPRLCA